MVQWSGGNQSNGRPSPLRGVLEALQAKAQPWIDSRPEHERPYYASVVRTGSEMLPGVGDLVGLEDLETATRSGDAVGMGLGLLGAIPGIPAVGGAARGARRGARRALGLLDAAPSPAKPIGLMGRTEADSALARYQAANPDDTGARVLVPGDEGYPNNAQWDEASQAYVAPVSIRDDGIYRGEDRVGRVRLSDTGGSLSIDDIEISPSYQSQGIGSEAIRQIQERARQEGRPVTLTSDAMRGKGNQQRQRALYERLGFAPNSGPDRVAERIGGRSVAPEYVWRGEPDTLPAEPDYPIRAYHGSPHSFDQFSLDAIGTGEGAQAYGHGLYFAESEDVARQYRDELSRHAIKGADGRMVQNRTLGDDEAALEALDEIAMAAGLPDLSRNASRYYNSYGDILDTALQRSGWDDLPAKIRTMRDAEIDNLERTYGSPEQIEAAREAYEGAARAAEYANQNGLGRHTGSMYEVGINAQPDTFLDWDRPLAEQPEMAERVNRAVRLTQQERETLPMRNILEMIGRPQEQTEKLRAAGINGIRYLDGGSRGAGQGSSNYVVFSDELIKVLRKYGITGLGLGTGTAIGAGAMQDDGGL